MTELALPKIDKDTISRKIKSFLNLKNLLKMKIF